MACGYYGCGCGGGAMCSNTVSTLNGSDLFSLFSYNNGCERSISAYNLLQYIISNLPANDEFVTQYETPASNGFSIQVNNNGDDTHLIMIPPNPLINGEIVLPNSTNVVDKQEIIVSTTNQINVISVNPNGANNVYGAPIVLASYDFFRLKFDSQNQSWFRIG